MDKSTRRVPTDPRLRRRRLEVDRARRNRSLIGAAVLVLIAAGVWAAFFSPLLDVRDLKLVGSKHTSPADVLEATGIEGDNLLLLSTERLEGVVAGLPWVARAKVDRILPDTVRVTIKERKPALVIEGVRGAWTVDLAGRVLARGRAKGYPVLETPVTGGLEPGAVVTHDGSVAVLRMYRSLPAQVRRRVVAIFAPSEERISFSLSDRTLVRYGSARMLTAKRRVLGALLDRLREQGRVALYIDVRVPSNPAIAQASPSPSATPVATPSPSPSA